MRVSLSLTLVLTVFISTLVVESVYITLSRTVFDVAYCEEPDKFEVSDAKIMKENKVTKTCCTQTQLDCRVDKEAPEDDDGKPLKEKYYMCLNTKQTWKSDGEEGAKNIFHPVEACCKKSKMDVIGLTFEESKLVAGCK